eukprot:COSAG02_NODE_8276_length_2634_cov_1.256016_3_plen_364_part_00
MAVVLALAGRKAMVPLVLLLARGLPACASHEGQQLIPSNDFAVTTNGAESFVYLATVPGAYGNGLVNASFVHVTLPPNGVASIRVAVKNRGAPVASAGLRPHGSPTVQLHGDSRLSFEISTAGHYILELDSSFNVTTLNAGLMIFADDAESSPPSAEDDSVVYFDAGVHVVPGGVIAPLSDSTVYLAQGAVVLAKVAATNVHNVTVRGPGILAAEWLPGTAAPYPCHHCGCPGEHGIEFVNSSDVTVAGITLMHVTSWMLVLNSVIGARVNGIRELGWRCNNDGVDIVSSQDVVALQRTVQYRRAWIGVSRPQAANFSHSARQFMPHGASAIRTARRGKTRRVMRATPCTSCSQGLWPQTVAF